MAQLELDTTNRSAGPGRHLLALGVLVLFAVYGALLNVRQDTVQWLRPSATLALGPGAWGMRSTADRRSHHLAWLRPGPQLTVLSWDVESRTQQVLTLPAEIDGAATCSLDFTDANRDGLADLSVHSGDLESGRTRETVVVQSGGSFEILAISGGGAWFSNADGETSVCAGDTTLRLAPARSTEATCLVSPDGGLRQSVAGWAFGVLDVDGDGRDEFLTVQEATNECTLVLHQLDQRHYRAIWSHRFSGGLEAQLDSTLSHGVTIPVSVFDYDDDGADDLLTVVPATGRGTVWTWAPPADHG